VAYVQAALHFVEHVHVGAAQQAAARALGLAALDDKVVVVANTLLDDLLRLAEHVGRVGLVTFHVCEGDHQRACSG
jgi:hypothetical protein